VQAYVINASNMLCVSPASATEGVRRFEIQLAAQLIAQHYLHANDTGLAAQVTPD
jgi:hypothetical protein